MNLLHQAEFICLYLATIGIAVDYDMHASHFSSHLTTGYFLQSHLSLLYLTPQE